jgi:two-component system, cell cycle sensor histidine kinase and response regulator CckA
MSEDSNRGGHDLASVAMKPTRTSETARLQVAQLTIESGLSLLDIFREACRIVSESLPAGRVGVWLMLPGQEALQCAVLYESSSKSFSEGTVLHSVDFPTYFAALKQRKIIPAEVAQHNPLTNELVESYLKPLNITSTLDAPILVAGEISGVFCCEHTGAVREWSTEERDFVESVANLLAAKTRAAEVQQLQNLLKLTEERIASNEKSDALARMAMGIAHDFRNILTVIQNCAELIGMSELAPPVKRNCDLITQAVSRGTQFVKELADFGKSSPTQPKVLDVNEQIQAFIPILRAAAGSQHRIDLKLEEKLGKILIDRNHLERMLLNLVMNAKDALPHGGTIDIIASIYGNLGSTKRVAIEIRDHGCGIDPQTMKRIFEPFFTTKSEGTGLGMPIVARFVERAGGSIEIESKLNVGTTVRLLIPLVGH